MHPRVFGLGLALVLGWPARATAQQPTDPAPEPGERGSGAVPRGGSGAVARPPPEGEEPTKKPVVVPPKLVKFVHAPYPEQAQKEGLTGEVILALTIDKQGKVTKAEIAESAGHGFDEAAQAAALEFEFEPATRDGRSSTSIPLR
jgi:TonB family protein